MMSSSRTRVLVVDDELSVRISLADYLEDRGFNTLSTAGAEEALEMLAVNPVDVAIVDIRLPEMGSDALIPKAQELEAANAMLRRQITARERAEKDQAKLLERLYHAQKMETIGLPAGGVAHDFNNLLTVISGHAELARGKVSEGSDVLASLAKVDAVVEHATGVARSLLSFSQKTPAEKRPIDLCAGVENVMRMLERTLPASVELVVDTTCKPAPWVNAELILLAGSSQSRSSLLTQRECEVLRYIARGMSKKEVARVMHVAVKTADQAVRPGKGFAETIRSRLPPHDPRRGRGHTCDRAR